MSSRPPLPAGPYLVLGLGDAGGDAVADRGEIRLGVSGRPLTLETRLPGAHNADNVAAAMAVAHALDIPPDPVAAALAETGAPGTRFELVDAGQPFLAVVDFAHNPDGVRRVLETARPLVGSGGHLREELERCG